MTAFEFLLLAITLFVVFFAKTLLIIALIAFCIICFVVRLAKGEKIP